MAHHAMNPHRDLQTIQPRASMAEAARIMCEHGVSALVVTEVPGGPPLSTVTDRDMTCLIAQGLDPGRVSVDQFIRQSCICRPSESWFG